MMDEHEPKEQGDRQVVTHKKDKRRTRVLIRGAGISFLKGVMYGLGSGLAMLALAQLVSIA
ncbi:hypothetical protein F4556_002375 [Kitasatospora gansuensis]|uniref:Uncharacterized protein n=1 Tax=Kitasatospora gansuensis TaxID=258050 RepID=A0A7W7SAE3_9ACTN|nr:hypothetical protein [Kitasatospora gansuensis]MBB4946840.1 hypothetical protein [Kitasatospora gansuensis]